MIPEDLLKVQLAKNIAEVAKIFKGMPTKMVLDAIDEFKREVIAHSVIQETIPSPEQKI